jgi:phosphatidylglycerol:prolipoprotein diacylglycerol transferase
MVALAVLTIVVWALLWARKDPKLSTNTVINAALVGIPSGIIFARLLHVIDYWSEYMENPSAIFSHFGEGLSIYGAVLGAALGIWIYSRISKFNYGYYTDMLAPGIILVQAIGRVGCTLNGCCYGEACDLPWAVTYTDPSHGTMIQSVHPTQVYEIFYNLIVFGILLILRKRFRPDGSLFVIYLTLYAVWRLGIGFIRTGNPLLFGLYEAQLISIVVIVICITIMIVKKIRWVKRDEINTEE